MPTRKSPPSLRVFRHSWQIRGVKARLVAAINACNNGATVELDIKSARNLVEICDQAIHTEEGHEPPPGTAA